ncbi:MAG TPA: sulfatase-like hydrolase/transferase [Solirubrobacteraceae bacterium]|nr:sulfatase-like hydrolase/transferase [Solirubrobacteraceae bacterium]
MRADEDKRIGRRIDRRTFLKRGLLAGSAVVGGGLTVSRLADATDGSGSLPARRHPARRPGKPNILVILVDQLRYPQWLASTPGGPSLPPNIQRLRKGAVSFARHYTASNDCTPARAALLTGLYTHQTGCMITGGSTLDPGFPTWGSMAREHGYDARWYGKWHLTHGDNRWTPAAGPQALERYGFAGGSYPSPDGAPGQGWRVDPEIAGQFEQWLSTAGGSEPWCTTVSFVNPHDIAWWYDWSRRVPAEAQAPRVAHRLPPNFETPELLVARNKPRLQRSLQETAASSFGAVPFAGPEVASAWLPFLDLYIKLQLEVDSHIGRVLDALESRPEVAANTVIVFTSDHGEYGASHGLRGKGAGAYEEAIKVPLIVKDPRGVLTRGPERTRGQLTSSVDVAPLLLTIATGANEWRREPRYAHLARRLDVARILSDPSAPGRPYVLHTTDEIVTEFAIEPYTANAPLHVLALRTPRAKYATYSHWPEGGSVPLAEGEERELYDYRTQGGRLELHNSSGPSPLEDSLHATLEHAYAQELRHPLPAHLHAARRSGFDDYFTIATRAAGRAAQRRAEHEREAQAPETTSAADGPLRP